MKPLLGFPLGKGEAAPTIKRHAGSQEQKKEASFVDHLQGLGMSIGFGEL